MSPIYKVHWAVRRMHEYQLGAHSTPYGISL